MQDCIKLFNFRAELAKNTEKTFILIYNILIFAGMTGKMNFGITKNRGI